jgi:hypothetical protein
MTRFARRGRRATSLISPLKRGARRFENTSKRAPGIQTLLNSSEVEIVGGTYDGTRQLCYLAAAPSPTIPAPWSLVGCPTFRSDSAEEEAEKSQMISARTRCLAIRGRHVERTVGKRRLGLIEGPAGRQGLTSQAGEPWRRSRCGGGWINAQCPCLGQQWRWVSDPPESIRADRRTGSAVRCHFRKCRIQAQSEDVCRRA